MHLLIASNGRLIIGIFSLILSVNLHYYDIFGRSLKEEEVFYTNDLESDSVKFAFETEYDELGRTSKRIYPNNLEVDYYYNAYGDLRLMESGGSPLWYCESVNSMGQITKYRMGSFWRLRRF